MKDFRLKRQLRAQAVERQEADDLAALARSLRQTPLPHLGRDAKDDIAEQLGLHPRRYRVVRRLSLATSFAVLAFLAITIQTAAPGSRLYNVKNTINKFLPWSHQLPAPSQPLMPIDDRPAQSLPSRSAQPGDSQPGTLPLQGGDSVKHGVTDTLQSVPSSLQPQGLDVPDELHNLLTQPPTTQPIPHKNL